MKLTDIDNRRFKKNDYRTEEVTFEKFRKKVKPIVPKESRDRMSEHRAEPNRQMRYGLMK